MTIETNTVETGDHYAMTLSLSFDNYGDEPAEIYLDTQFVDGLIAGNKLGRNRRIVLRPAEERILVWRRHSTAKHEYEMCEDEVWAFVRIEYVTRDLASNVTDVNQVTGDLRFFRRDGSRLVVEPAVMSGWTEDFGVPIKPRQYRHDTDPGA